MKVNYKKGRVRLNKRGHIGIVFSKDVYQIVDNLDMDLTKQDFMAVSGSGHWDMFDKNEIELNKEDIMLLFHYIGDAILGKVGKKELGGYDFVKICNVLFMKGITGKDVWTIDVTLDCLNRVEGVKK